MRTNKELTGAILTTLGGICWGLSGSMGQYLFTRQGMDSRWLVPIRLGLAGIILLVLLAALRTEGPISMAKQNRSPRSCHLRASGRVLLSVSVFSYDSALNSRSGNDSAGSVSDHDPVCQLQTGEKGSGAA